MPRYGVSRLSSAREPEDTNVMRKMAKEYFRNSEQDILATMLGKSVDSLEYDDNELLTLQARMRMAPIAREVIPFYNFCLTIDRLLTLIRSLSAQVGMLQRTFRDEFKTTLDQQIMSPDFVPWNMESQSPTDRVVASVLTKSSDRVRTGYPLAVAPFVQEEFTAELILLSYPAINMIVGLGQGSYIRFTQAPVNWDQARPFVWHDMSDPNTMCGPYVQASAGRDSWDLPGAYGAHRNAGYVAGPGPVVVDHNDQTRLAILTKLANGAPFPMGAIEAAIDPVGNPTFAKELKRAYKRTDVAPWLAAKYRELQIAYARARSGTDAAIQSDSAMGFADNMFKGSLGLSQYQCGPGEAPTFIGWDGTVKYADEALQMVNGELVVNEKVVMPGVSGCSRAPRINTRIAPFVATGAMDGGAAAAAAATAPRQYFVRGKKGLGFNAHALALGPGDRRGSTLGAKHKRRTHKRKAAHKATVTAAAKTRKAHSKKRKAKHSAELSAKRRHKRRRV